MEFFGIALGLIFWPVVFATWYLLRRRFRPWPRRLITLLIVGMPALGAVSMAWSCFVDEPLIQAASEGDVPAAEHLLAIGASPNMESKGGVTALGYAVGNEHVEMVRLLLAHGGDVNAGDPDRTPLAYAAQSHNAAIVALIRRAGAAR